MTNKYGLFLHFCAPVTIAFRNVVVVVVQPSEICLARGSTQIGRPAFVVTTTTSSAFSASSSSSSSSSSLQSSFANNDDYDDEYFPHQDFERAIECACTTSLCNDSELSRLANVLEACQGCFYLTEDDEECQQEQVDRQDVVDILRMDASLQLRQVYLKNVNLFKERVENAPAESNQSKVMETMNRAIECASQGGLCSVEELNELADALEGYTGCLIDDEECDQELIDRQDVVDILRMDAALQLRQVYLVNANSFKEAVEEAQQNVQDTKVA